MKQYLFAVAVATLALGACKRDPAPAAVPEAAPAVVDAAASAPAPAAPIDPVAPAGAAAEFDTRAFAGTFSTLGTSLEIAADGTYRLNEHTESANAELATTDGTWTVESDGKQILLDPHSKSHADRRYDIVSQDELRSVDGGQSLGREGSSR